LGEAYLDLKKYDQAVKEFKQALIFTEGPVRSAIHYGLGLAYLKGGQKESALREYEILGRLNEELAQRLLEEVKSWNKTWH
jgi:tetratricopeptide (TPR) repeat protein